MKLRNLFFIATACTGLMFTSCTNELDETVGNGIEQVQAEAFASISFQMPSTAGTRAGDGEVVGSSEENEIRDVMILLFKQDGTTVQAAKRDRADFAPSITGGATSYTLKADKNIQIVTADNYQVLVVVNPATSLTEADGTPKFNTMLAYKEYIEVVLSKSGAYCTKNTFMMSNANAATSINVTKANNKENPAHMTIPVERLAAKFAFDNTKNTDVEITSGIGTVTFNAYKVINTRNDAYALRRVSKSYTDFTEPIKGVGGVELNNYVVENRFDAKATWDKTGIYDKNYSRRMDTYVAFRTLKATGSQDIAYALENTVKATENQPIGYTSGVILRGKVTLAAGQLIGTANADGTFYGFRTKFYASLSEIKKEYDPKAEDVFQYAAKKVGAETEAEYLTRISNLKKELYDLGVELFANGNCYYNYWIRHNNDGNSEVNADMEYAIVRNNVYQLAINSVSGMGNFESGTPGPGTPGEPEKGQEDVTDGGTNPEIPGTVDPSQEPTTPVIPVDPETPVIDTKMYLNMALKVLPWTVRKNNIDL